MAVRSFEGGVEVLRGPAAGVAAVLALSTLLSVAPGAHADIGHLAAGTVSTPASLGQRTITGLAVDADGTIYTGARSGNAISVVVFDRDGKHLRDFAVDSFTQTVDDEVDLAVSPDSLLYYAHPSGAKPAGTISVYTTAGSLVREMDLSTELNLIADIEVDAAGNLYVLSRGDPPRGDEVVKLSPAGTVLARFEPVPGQRAPFESDLGGLALAPDGSIWVTTPIAGSRLVHLAADGGALPAPPLDTIVPLGSRRVKDVEFAAAFLYVAAGAPNGMVVITPEGRLVDRIGGEARQIAVAADRVYTTKLDPRTGLRAVASQDPFSEGSFSVWGRVVSRPPTNPSGVDASGCGGNSSTHTVDTLVHVTLTTSSGPCAVRYYNYGRPSCPDGSKSEPAGPYVAGRPVGQDRLKPLPAVAGPDTWVVELDGADVGNGGAVIVQWNCPGSAVFESKGAIQLIDPSGNVLDRSTGKPIQGATVRLEFTPARGGRFGRPSLSLLSPQINPQTTGPGGAFAWDVAPGFWRLRVTAFGYRTLTTKPFKIPPEVTGLRLRLRHSAAFGRLIDPAGRVGSIRLGARSRSRPSGLRIRSRRGKVREISVRARRFRTADGVKLGSRQLDLLRAYPRARRSGPRRRGGPTVLRFKRAFFTVRGGRVVAIRLARR